MYYTYYVVHVYALHVLCITRSIHCSFISHTIKKPAHLVPGITTITSNIDIWWRRLQRLVRMAVHHYDTGRRFGAQRQMRLHLPHLIHSAVGGADLKAAFGESAWTVHIDRLWEGAPLSSTVERDHSVH